jgi:nickel-dependent lactate racemase
LLIVVNDGHRPTPTSEILAHLNRIDSTLLDRAFFMIAAGTHSEPTAAHYTKIFGDFYDRLKDRLSFHDAHDKSRMRSIGVDHLGGEVWLNNALFEYDRVMLISSVEPHYFAGYTGGRKSILPGLADFKAIERNHNLANSLQAAPLKLGGNPVAEHMAAVLDMLGAEKYFGIQVVIDAHKKLAGAFFGDLKTSFEGAVEYSAGMYGHRVPKPYDVVICELLPPLDGNLYQLQKALENCQPAVKDGGTILLVSECKNGVGSDHFFNLAQTWDRDKNVAAGGQLHFGSHKLSRVNAISKRINVRLYSSLPADKPRQVFYEPVDDIQPLLTDLLTEQKAAAIVYDSGNTVLTT